MDWLSPDCFKNIVENTPLISVDLVVRNISGEVLLGQRLNRPAKGFWFVPGGRILKNETLADAFLRLTKAELGQAFEITSARYLGLYEHFYTDSVFGVQPDTHYVVNAFELIVTTTLNLPKTQHNQYQWLSESDLLQRDDVHCHTKWYFESNKGYKA
jgi:colanic acid biosynthesis protein WcaH